MSKHTELSEYTKGERDWAEECLRTDHTNVIRFLIEMRRTTEKRQREDEARDLIANKVARIVKAEVTTS